jgi:MFS family permease
VARTINTRFGGRRYYGWTIVVTLGITTLISYGTTQYLFGLLVEPLTREFGWSTTAIGAAYSGTVLVSGVMGVALGSIVDRIGARALLTAGSALSGISLLLLARVHTLVAFDLLWGIGMGLGAALTYYPVSFTVITNWFATGRVHAFSVLTFMGAFSSTIFYPLGGLLIHAFGWRDTLVVFGLIQLLVALPLHAIVVRRHPEDHGLHPDGALVPGESTPQSGIALRLALRGVSFWLITIAVSLAYFASTLVLLEHVAFLIHRGFAPALVAMLAGLLGLAYLPGRGLVIYANGRLPLAAQLMIVCFVQAAGIILLNASTSILGIIAYVVVFGAAYGAVSPLRAAIMAERFGRRSYGAILAVQGVPVGVFSALGPLVGGRLIDLAGYGLAFGACVVALAAAGLLVSVEGGLARLALRSEVRIE